MTAPKFKYIYGPVYSWRMGFSLGIDPLNTSVKSCNFGCSYCQLGLADVLPSDRRVFVPASWIVEEVKALPQDCKIDYLTFSGNGEPTLASNLGEMMLALRDVRPEKIAVITNATLITRPDVRRDLRLADLVLLKIDAPDQDLFEKINHPVKGLRLADIIKGIKDFKKTFEGKLALQIMFMEANKAFAREIAQVAREISPDEVQLNTPLRPSDVRPLSQEDMAEIKKDFDGMNVRSVYEEEKKVYQPFDDSSTEKRHGKFKN
ncbi:MAG: radical SAM protein [Candidatus Omnitrophica bacterium]|nr:radical SAM protein [Candidatus Omnitrophota bacterium]